ncbi:LytTR family transcriptional regulator [Phenylobacterium sp. J426]|uniref:LytTR family DNA-binding domain-containing protein n=1 Tax=Phenylobacterium sp. J426 TaxID=2898439 RepID=UPI002151F8F6|nr:LytTR family DNA-binding domain-containing protein [Phenylobacterium sp. J426]MCR5875029.1 LytTR family transcriptional regulator [Phenylobacterium sp. J426]
MPSVPLRNWTSPFLTSVYGALALGVFLGFSGPFGSFRSLSAPPRYAFWFGCVATGYGLAIATLQLLRPMAAFARLPKVAAIILVGLVSTLPMMFVVAWGLQVVLPGRSTAPGQLVSLYFSVAAVQVVIAGIATWPFLAPRDAAPAADDPNLDRFFERVPERLGRDLLALEAQDHYLMVHTRRGSALIYMPLSEATQILPRQLGFQAHRRWWVARKEVERLRRDGHQTHLELTGGLTVPVGRTYLAAVRASLAASVALP